MVISIVLTNNFHIEYSTKTDGKFSFFSFFYARVWKEKITRTCEQGGKCGKWWKTMNRCRDAKSCVSRKDRLRRLSGDAKFCVSTGNPHVRAKKNKKNKKNEKV